MNETTRLKIGGVPEHFNLPWRLAIEEGDLKDKNIHLHWEDMTGGTGQMIRGLKNHSIDIAVLLTEGITKAILQGLDAKIIQVYVTSPLHWGIHVASHDKSIQKVDELEGKTFAISREGSGSELMAYVLADQRGWDISKLRFNSVGDIYGLLWALQNNEASTFLWERFTTKPYVDAGKCRYIEDVVTPWPSFVVAVRNDVWEEYKDDLKIMLEVVNKKSEIVKNHEGTPGMLSWRYNQKLEDVKQWLAQTDWNYSGEPMHEAYENVIKYLLKLNLVSEEEAKDYMKKLF